MGYWLPKPELQASFCNRECYLQRKLRKTKIMKFKSLCIGTTVFFAVAASALAQQLIKPNTTYQAAGTSSGQSTATAQADCIRGTLLGGGGSCRNSKGLVGISASYPNGNLWLVKCDSDSNELVIATANAICLGSSPPSKMGVEITASNRF
jgi:opacity protein-like surface antigen